VDVAHMDIAFAEIAVKHLKSNAIALVKNRQLIGAGSGQTSRVDAVRQAIAKAKQQGFETKGSVLSSDAFFPFPDNLELALQAGVGVVVQPGGSVKDEENIQFCQKNGLAMVLTGVRHFKH
jgi:phosphoribosylaminoimidazolecarboxamide formyltransferase/IMP cyclohydrolase